MAEQRNEGEGNRTAAREYNKAQQEFIRAGKVKPAAEEAERALDTPERDEMREAEEKGRKPAAPTEKLHWDK